MRELARNEIKFYLCSNRSRPLLVRSAYPAGHFLFMEVRYNKQAISIEEQIETLKGRGLLIDDENAAKEVLDVISYFRLAGYWRHMELGYGSRQFKPNKHFSDVLDCYYFDKELRLLIFSAIQSIEIAVRSKIIKHFTPQFGAFWFMDADCMTNHSHFESNLLHLQTEVRRSHDDFIADHFRKYSEPDLPPVWKTLEVISFGTLSKLFTNFQDASCKHSVAHEFALRHHKFLKSWLECVAVLRNCCAHHARLWNRVFSIMPKMPRNMSGDWLTDFSFREQSLYPQLCCLAYWLNSFNPSNTFVSDFKSLLKRHPSVSTRLMGFPADWENEPLWS